MAGTAPVAPPPAAAAPRGTSPTSGRNARQSAAGQSPLPGAVLTHLGGCRRGPARPGPREAIPPVCAEYCPVHAVPVPERAP